jgi:hypothetical protein
MPYSVLFHISGVPSWLPPPAPITYDHAKPNRFTLVESICFNVL